MLRRFIPDTLLEALVRPIAMAFPDAGVYVEFMAPDLRFLVFFVVLIPWLGLVAWRRKEWLQTPLHRILLLGLLIVLSFPLWLLSSGNGRYLMPVVILVGPLLIAGLMYLMVDKAKALFASAILLLAQWGMVLTADPFGVWSLIPWRGDGYFDIEVPAEYKTGPHIFVTISGISYSLMAPKFDPHSSWIHLDGSPVDRQHMDRFDARRRLWDPAEKPILIVPVPMRFKVSQPEPSVESLGSMNRMIEVHDRVIDNPSDCSFAPSSALSAFGEHASDNRYESKFKKGFWFCKMTFRSYQPPLVKNVDLHEYELAFNFFEQRCPSHFPSGQSRMERLDDGYKKHYPQSDTDIYALNSGQVYLKYFRRLNPQYIGTIDQFKANAIEFSCSDIKGREPLPWQRH